MREAVRAAESHMIHRRHKKVIDKLALVGAMSSRLAEREGRCYIRLKNVRQDVEPSRQNVGAPRVVKAEAAGFPRIKFRRRAR